MTKTLVEQYVEDPEHMRLFQQERAIYEVTELLESVMRETGVTRAELARRLGRSKGWVTQMLDGQANKTIRTVADAFAVLGREYCSFQRPIQIARRAVNRTSSSKPSAGYRARSVINMYDPAGPTTTTGPSSASSEEALIEAVL